MKTPERTKNIQVVFDSIRNLVRALRVNSRAIEKDLGLSSAQLFVLQQLQKKDGISINELAQATHTHQSSVSVVVQKLAKRKCVIKKPSRHDSRQTEIYLTSVGLETLKKAPRSAQELLMETLEKMPLSQLESLATNLSDLIQESGFDVTPAPLFFEEGPRS